jgi:hypothetical protein
MNRFIKRGLLFTLVFFCIDKLFIPVRNAAPGLEVDRRLEWIVTGKMDADLVILGSSRGARCLIAEQITQSTGTPSMNFSYPGSNVEFHEFLLRQITENKGNTVPKTVVLVVDDSDELTPSVSLKFRLDRLYPLVKYRAIRDEMVKRGEKIPVVNELLILHQINKSNLWLHQKKFTKNDVIMPCGSMPIPHQKNTFDKQFGSKDHTYQRGSELSEKLEAFKQIVARCRDHKIQLIVVIPPNFKEVTHGFRDRLVELVGDAGSVWMYDESRPEYRDREFFFDHAHLRTSGAKIFTEEFIQHFKTTKVGN